MTLKPGDAGSLDEHLPTKKKSGPDSRFSDAELSEMRRLKSEGNSNEKIGKEFGITGQHVGKLLRRTTTIPHQLPIEGSENAGF